MEGAPPSSAASSAPSLDTQLILAGKTKGEFYAAVVTPIFQTSTYLYDGPKGHHPTLRYMRYNNSPNHLELSAKVAALEGTEAALALASGMAAISTTIFALLKSGDRLLSAAALYGGSFALFKEDLPASGIEVDYVDVHTADVEAWKAKLTPQTKAIYVEGATNPLLRVPDHGLVVKFARENNLISIIDNTFLSPINFRPAVLGYDIVIHSATKYLNGHNDIVAGVVAGSDDLISKIGHKALHLGGTLEPMGLFLLTRGLKTLAVRVRHQSKSAAKIAAFLEAHPKIAKVSYPGLASHPDHELAKKYFTGFSAMLSFELKKELGHAAIQKFLHGLTIPHVATSLGGVESLVTLPSTSSHAALTQEEREKIGISDFLVRMSVGLEDASDIIEDLKNALAAL